MVLAVKPRRVKDVALYQGYKGTPVRIRFILEALEQNKSFSVAAKAGGISRDTLCRWCDRNPTIRRLVQEAKLRGEQQVLDDILSASKPHEVTKVVQVVGENGEVKSETTETRTVQEWQAGAWFLERRNPQEYGRRDRLSVSGDAQGAPIRTQAVPSEDVASFLEAFRSDPQAVLAAVRTQRALHANTADPEPAIDADFHEESAIDSIPTHEQGTQET